VTFNVTFSEIMVDISRRNTSAFFRLT